MVRFSSALSSERYQTTCAIFPTSANVLTCQHQSERTTLLAPRRLAYTHYVYTTPSRDQERPRSKVPELLDIPIWRRYGLQTPPSLEDIEETSRQARGGFGHCVPVSLPCRDFALTLATGPAVQMMQIASVRSRLSLVRIPLNLPPYQGLRPLRRLLPRHPSLRVKLPPKQILVLVPATGRQQEYSR